MLKIGQEKQKNGQEKSGSLLLRGALTPCTGIDRGQFSGWGKCPDWGRGRIQ